MTPIATGIFGFVVLLILLFLGTPVAIAMMFVGFVGICSLTSFEAASFTLTRTLYETASHYPYTIIPLFVFMGSLASSSGMTRELFETFQKWFGRLPGGLGLATIASSAAFAALSGSSVASSAAMATIAIPEMRRSNYAPHFAAGIVAAGGTLSFLIPPSLGFVVYGILTDQSIGRLLISGIVPGAILSLLYASTAMFWAHLDPTIAPTGREIVTLRQKILSLRGTWQVFSIFLLTVGGIYLGFLNPTEAGAIGAAAIFFISLLRRRLTLETLISSLLESAKISVMVLFIVAGANVFSYFLALSTLPLSASRWIVELGISKHGFLSLLILLYLFLGCFFDAISMMVLTMPVVFPLVQAAGFHPIWFGVFCVLMMEAGLITPPLGLNVYAIAASLRDVPMFQVFKGALPFLPCIMILVILLTLFPEIALFLPSLMER